MDIQTALIQLVSPGTTGGTIPTKSFTVTDPPADLGTNKATVSLSGIVIDYSGKKVTFDYFASINYVDTNDIQRFAFINGSVTTVVINDLVKINNYTPTVTAAVTSVYNGITDAIDFDISYSVNYKKYADTLVELEATIL